MISVLMNPQNIEPKNSKTCTTLCVESYFPHHHVLSMIYNCPNKVKMWNMFALKIQYVQRKRYQYFLMATLFEEIYNSMHMFNVQYFHINK